MPGDKSKSPRGAFGEEFMIRRHATALHVALMIADATAAFALFVTLSIVRLGPDGWRDHWEGAGVDALIAASAYGLAVVFVLWLQGLYQVRVRWSLRREISDVVVAITLLAFAVFTGLFLFKLPEVSRLLLLLLFPAQIVLTLMSRIAIRAIFARARERGFLARYLLVVGANPAAEAFANLIASHRELGLVPVGHLVGPADRASGRDATVSRPILGDIDAIETLLHVSVIDEVAVCLNIDDRAYLEPIARLCEDEGRIVRIPQLEPGMLILGGRIEQFFGTPILSLVYGPDRVVGLLAKRAIDIVLALVGLIVLSPVFVAVAAAMVVMEGRPVLFRQVRVGLHGRPFSIVKFRTMVADAEARYEEVALLSDTKGAAFKMKADPRVNRLGRLLRTTSIDELPQLWNVLRGQMSIVGPRPAPPREVALYDVWHRRRLSMKPGITGLWQIEARMDEDFDNRARLDLSYIDGWSLLLDIRIILRTIPALVTNPGH